jgi:hypothetical protein
LGTLLEALSSNKICWYIWLVDFVIFLIIDLDISCIHIYLLEACTEVMKMNMYYNRSLFTALFHYSIYWSKRCWEIYMDGLVIRFQ